MRANLVVRPLGEGLENCEQVLHARAHAREIDRRIVGDGLRRRAAGAHPVAVAPGVGADIAVLRLAVAE